MIPSMTKAYSENGWLCRCVFTLPSAIFWAWTICRVLGFAQSGDARMWIWISVLPLLPFLWAVMEEREQLQRRSLPSLLKALGYTIGDSFLYFPGGLVWVSARVVAALAKIARCGVCFVLFSQRAGVASMMLLVLVGVLLAQSLVTGPAIAIFASILAVLIFEVLLLRGMRWAFNPAQRLWSVLPVNVALKAVAYLFDAASVALEIQEEHSHEDDTMVGSGSEDGERSRVEVRVAVCRWLSQVGKRMARAIPTSRTRLVQTLIAGWLVLSLIAVFVFAVLFYSFDRAGIPMIRAITSSNGLGKYVAASTAVFTRAPIASVDPLNTWGLLLCALELANSLALLGLFIALVIRVVPHDSQNLNQLDTASIEFDEKLDNVIERLHRDLEKTVRTEEPKTAESKNPSKSAS